MRKHLGTMTIFMAALVGASTSFAQSAKERIRVFALENRPIFGLQQIQKPASLETHIYEFDEAGKVSEIKLAAKDVITGFSETTYLLSKDVKLVIPSGTAIGKTPTLIHIVPQTQGSANQSNSKQDLKVDIASDTDLALINSDSAFVSTPPVRYQKLSENGEVRMILQTNKVGQNFETTIFRVKPNQTIVVESVKSVVIGFSNTIFMLSSGEVLDVPTMPDSAATLTSAGPTQARLKPQVITSPLTEVEVVEEMKARIHSANPGPTCGAILSDLK